MKVCKYAYYWWIRYQDIDIMNSSKVKLKVRIKAIFEQSSQIYGSCRVQKKLERAGLIFTRSCIGLIMKDLGLISVLIKKYVITTDSKHSFPLTNNELDRDFTTFKIG